MLDISAQNLFGFRTKDTEDKFSVNLYRTLALIGSIAYPLSFFVLHIAYPENQDSLALRLVMSALCLLIFSATYSNRFFSQYNIVILYLISFSAVAHFTYLLWVNHFQVFYYIGYVILVFTFSVTYRQVRDLWIFLVCSLGGIIITSLYNLDSRDASFYIFSTGLLFAVISVLLTNKIQSEEEVNLGTHLLESLYQESPDAIIIVEQKADKILRINKKALSLFNIVDEEKYEYKPLRELTGMDLQRTNETIQSISSVTGKKFWVNIARENFFIHGEQYGIIRMLDVSDDKQKSDELMLKDGLLTGVTEACSDLLLKTDFDSAIKGAIRTLGKATRVDRVYVYENNISEAGETVFAHRYEWVGATDSFRIGRKRLQGISYQEFLPRWFSELNKGKTIKGNVADFPQAEKAILEPRGTQSLMVVPIIIDEKFSGFIGFDNCSEKHDRNNIEESILKSAAAAISGAISKQLKEKEIVLAMEATESASKAKESFLANVSHEIRTPMNGIIGLTQLIQKSKLDEKQTQYITAIKQSSEHLLVIINDLLDFSKIVAGQMEFENIEFDLSSLLYNINQTYGNRALDKGIYLQTDVSDDVPTKMMGDPVRLNQVLVNLIGNSIKFTETGGVTIRISCLEKNENNVRLRFSIDDTGIGIPENKLDSIFESFKQADKDTARKYGGTGLGLSIVKKLVDGQNGKVWVESESGKGSSFIFELGFELHGEAKVNTETVASYHSLTGINILLAEDNVVNQLLANDLISEWGAMIDIADNGEIAINKLRLKKYDVVLMDVQMPVVNGLEATEIIRNYSEESIRNIPVIAMTANAIKGDSEKCIAAGMNDYITKPFKPLDLNHKIWQYISDEKKNKTAEKNKPSSNQAPVEKEFKSELIDLANLKEFSRGKNDFLLKMLNLLIEQTPPAVAQIGDAIPKQDWETVRALAHKMKPNIGLLGNAELDAMILKLEKDSDSKSNLEALPSVFDNFNLKLSPALDEVRRAQSHFKTLVV